MIEDYRNKPAQDIHGPEEVPVTLALNEVEYATSLVTPSCLEAWAIGFCYTEGLIENAAQVDTIEKEPLRHGWLVRLRVDARLADMASRQRRVGTSVSSCGRCGSASETVMMLGLKQLAPQPMITESVLQVGLRQLSDQRRSGMHVALGVYKNEHGEAAAPVTGFDIGRHNALDKLIGQVYRGNLPLPSVVIMSSRCSLELVQKVIRANIPALATLAIPSTLAIETARLCGLQLYYCHRGERIELLSGRTL
ncbi:Sulfur carrier protein FdhD [Halomonadaceae bacterium LMG 33818]|uniref:formate dehydrogenase accessory sulfurtransferase FdhD n=1 Tax=Cernens ardua TaxID=3402176 RepID=UPI003EDC4F24